MIYIFVDGCSQHGAAVLGEELRKIGTTAEKAHSERSSYDDHVRLRCERVPIALEPVSFRVTVLISNAL